MQIELSVRGRTLWVRLRGELDVATADAFRRAVDQELDRGKVRDLHVHMAGVSLMDSTGLGVLLGRYRRIRRLGGRLVLVSPTPTVRQVVHLSGLHRVLEIRDDAGATAGQGG